MQRYGINAIHFSRRTLEETQSNSQPYSRVLSTETEQKQQLFEEDRTCIVRCCAHKINRGCEKEPTSKARGNVVCAGDVDLHQETSTEPTRFSIFQYNTQ
jgi:hypothetical protein